MLGKKDARYLIFRAYDYLMKDEVLPIDLVYELHEGCICPERLTELYLENGADSATMFYEQWLEDILSSKDY